MAVEQKKRKLAVRPVAAPQPSTTLRVAPECELFALAITGGDGNKLAIYDRLRAMMPAERNRLRLAVERLDGMLDQVALDLHFERNKSRSKGGRKNES